MEIKTEKMFIVGIDPGYSNMGLVVAYMDEKILVVKEEFSEKAVSWSNFNTCELLTAVWDWFDKKLKHYLDFIKEAYFEDQYFNPFAKHSGFVGMKLRTLQVAIVAYFLKNNIKVFPVPSASVKKAFKLTTKDRAENKKAVMKYLKTEFDLTPKTDHTGDSILLLAYMFKPNKVILKT